VTAEQNRPHILSELGFDVRRDGDELTGSAWIVPEMCVPDLPNLRTSILAAWADQISGLLTASTMSPRVPVTLDLSVDVFDHAPGSGLISCAGAIVKSGRSVTTATVEFHSEEGGPFATGTGAFMAAPDVTLTMPSILSFDGPPAEQTLSTPWAQRARCQRLEPGVAILHRSDDGMNAANTVNGGLLALVAEEAALSLAPDATLCSIALRYLRPVRMGPVVATAVRRAACAQVTIRDAGANDRLSTVATVRYLTG
jgi:acyl-coenzyme A thioesterase PaaI-like protein